MKKILAIFATLTLFTGSAAAAAIKTIPNDLKLLALSDQIVYDSEFNYSKLKAISNIDIFPSGFSPRKELVDHVIVNKQHHQMLLMKGDQVVKTFWIALSDRPVGAKHFEGDRKTPEGTYTLDYIKNKSTYYKAMHISYPNSKDVEYARRSGMRPGGMIMVHGQPGSRSEYQETVQRTNWTSGCIALLNPDIDLFLSLVDVGTPITINP